MRRIVLPCLILAIITLNYVRAETEMVDGAPGAMNLITLAKKARPAVLLLIVSDAAGKEIATGTGFLVSSDGKLITNHHVIEHAASAVAKAENGGLFPVEGVLADDPKNDLVLLKLKAKDLPFLTLGKSEKIEVGTRIAVIGSPLGLEGTLSEGIVSAIRELMDDVRLLQVTAAISPGSSGSPVLNASGEVVGVASSFLRTGQGLNFAVPVETVTTLSAKGNDGTTIRQLGTFVVGDEGKYYADEDHRAGIAAYAAGDYVEALKNMRGVLERFPNMPVAQFNVGCVYEKLRFDADAIASYEKALKQNPNFWQAWLNVGRLYCFQEDFAKGVRAIQEAIKLQPSRADNWHVLGLAYHLQANYEEAIRSHRQAVRLKPDLTEAWFFIGVAFLKQQENDQAVENFRKTLALNTDHAGAWEGLGVALCSQRKYVDGIDALNRAIRIEPNCASAWHVLGVFYSSPDVGRCHEAVEIVERLLKIDPQRAARLAAAVKMNCR